MDKSECTFLQRRLKALRYPHTPSLTTKDQLSVRKLVKWLEGEKIRKLKKHERTGLKAIGEEGKKLPHQWFKAFFDYLEMLDPPFDIDDNVQNWKETMWLKTLDFLVGKAVMEEYADNKEQFNSRAPRRHKTQKIFTGCGSKEFKDALSGLCELLNIPEATDVVTTTRAVRDVLVTKFSSTAIESFKESVKSGYDDPCAKIHDPKTLLNENPDILEFSTGDELVDAAIAILRLMYIRDIRETQTQLNAVISAVQNYTSNPKTNHKLGRVGR